MHPTGPDSLLIIVPAYNEEGAVGEVVRSIHTHVPGVPVLVLDDCSGDNTVGVARAAGAEVLALPHHLGLGGCVQAGYKLAHELGFQNVIRVDGDGQHDARDIPRVFEKLKTSGCEMVIGSRFAEENGSRTSLLRKFGIRFFRTVLRPILGKPVHDPTSGFVGVNHKALEVFARSFPLEYPEIEALVVLQRRRFRFEEVPCKMHPRTTGRTSITPAKSLYYIVHVLLGVFVNVLKYDRLLRRKMVEQAVSPVNRPEAGVGAGRQAKPPVPPGGVPPGSMSTVTRPPRVVPPGAGG
jgi:glycosyltransferase involved in cell wall biosynthesis